MNLLLCRDLHHQNVQRQVRIYVVKNRQIQMGMEMVMGTAMVMTMEMEMMGQMEMVTMKEVPMIIMVNFSRGDHSLIDINGKK
jgi:hypothetical protein